MTDDPIHLPPSAVQSTVQELDEASREKLINRLQSKSGVRDSTILQAVIEDYYETPGRVPCPICDSRLEVRRLFNGEWVSRLDFDRPPLPDNAAFISCDCGNEGLIFRGK